jgi:hypothetical protein
MVSVKAFLAARLSGWLSGEVSDWRDLYKDLAKEYAARGVEIAAFKGALAASQLARESLRRRMGEHITKQAATIAEQQMEIKRLRALVDESVKP